MIVSNGPGKAANIPPGSPAEKDIKDRYAAGSPMAPIAKDYGVSTSVIRRILLRVEQTIRPRGYPPDLSDTQTYWQRRYQKVKADPELLRLTQEQSYSYSILRKYGISREEYDELVTLQRNRCAICLEVPTKRLRIDHCHTTGQIRGLLCDECNRALGFFRDKIENLDRAVRYLESRLPSCS